MPDQKSKPELTTKAAVPAPKRARASFLGGMTDLPLAAPTTAPSNMIETNYANLNFKVEPEFKRQFRLTAVSHSLSSKDLLEQCFAAWLREQKAK